MKQKISSIFEKINIFLVYQLFAFDNQTDLKSLEIFSYSK